MRYTISATQETDGTITAKLFVEGDPNSAIATATLKNLKDVDKWAAGAARDHKNENTPAPNKHLTYVHSFSL